MRCILVVTALAVIPAVRASASDSKIYPASMCQPESASHAAHASFSGGRVCNVSNVADITVRCPVVRDIVAGHASHFRVYGKTGDPAGILCVLRSLSPDAEQSQVDHKSVIIPLHPTNDPDAWSSAQSFQNLAQVADGPLELSCILPRATPWTSGLKQSCVGSYRLEEAE